MTIPVGEIKVGDIVRMGSDNSLFVAVEELQMGGMNFMTLFGSFNSGQIGKGTVRFIDDTVFMSPAGGGWPHMYKSSQREAVRNLQWLEYFCFYINKKLH